MIKEKVLKYIETNFGNISPETVEIYKKKLKPMTDKQVKEYFEHAKFRLYVKDEEVSEDKVDQLVKRMKVVPQEHMVLPYKGPGVVSKSEVMIFPVQVRRLQQLATKQSKSGLDVSNRNKAGQAAGDDKTGRITDPEVNQLASLGLDRVLTELMSPRSDNLAGKKVMNDQIEKELTFELSNIPITKSDKATLNYIDALYKSINIATDFIDYIDQIS